MKKFLLPLLSMLIVSASAFAETKIVVIDFELKNITIQELKAATAKAMEQNPALVYLANFQGLIKTSNPTVHNLSPGQIWGMKGAYRNFCAVLNFDSNEVTYIKKSFSEEVETRVVYEGYRAENKELLVGTTVTFFNEDIFKRNDFSGDCPIPTQTIVHIYRVQSEKDPTPFTSSAVTLNKDSKPFHFAYNYGDNEAFNRRILKESKDGADIVALNALTGDAKATVASPEGSKELQVTTTKNTVTGYKSFSVTLP